MMRLKRKYAGFYETPDGEYYVWQSPNRGDYERRWWVNSRIWDREVGETLIPYGFATKWEAVRWLEHYLTEEKVKEQTDGTVQA